MMPTKDMAKILIIEDEAPLAATLAYNIRQEGHEAITAQDGVAGLEAVRQGDPDLIVLDVMLPRLDSLEVCRLIRREFDVPISMLTARSREVDKVVGLEAGADDYVTKPFSPRELTARVRAVLRRMEKHSSGQDVLRGGQIQVDLAGRSASLAGQAVELTPSEFDLLATLMGAPGRVFSRLELLDRLQGTAYEGYERTIDVHIRNLRTKIEPDPRNPRYVVTVYGIGYRLLAEPLTVSN